jgi:hypothetical protein
MTLANWPLTLPLVLAAIGCAYLGTRNLAAQARMPRQVRAGADHRGARAGFCRGGAHGPAGPASRCSPGTGSAVAGQGTRGVGKTLRAAHGHVGTHGPGRHGHRARAAGAGTCDGARQAWQESGSRRGIRFHRTGIPRWRVEVARPRAQVGGVDARGEDRRQRTHRCSDEPANSGHVAGPQYRRVRAGDGHPRWPRGGRR